MNEMDRFRQLPPIHPEEMMGLWAGRGIPSGHPLDGVLENLGWFGKRFTAEMRADALLFRAGPERLIAIDPVWIPLRFALRFSKLGRARATGNLLSHLLRRLSAKGPVASLKTLPFEGMNSAAMIYDTQPITDHFRKIEDGRVMGVMVISGRAARGRLLRTFYTLFVAKTQAFCLRLLLSLFGFCYR